MGAVPFHDTPKQKPRVKMRVKVRPRKTSLPLAHDEVYNDFGSNTVNQGEQVIVVYVDDIPRVMAKVEHDHVKREQAHASFWRQAVAATIETMKNTGQRVTPDQLPIPDVIGVSVNAWVMSRWPYDPTGRATYAGNAFFDWMTKHCAPEGRNPEAIFAHLAGRGLLPLDSAEVIEGSEHGAPVSDDQRQILATAKVLKETLGTAMGGNASASENEALKAQVAELTARLNALAASLGEKPGKPTK